MTELPSAHLTASPALTAATSASSAHLSAAASLLAPARMAAAVLTAGTHLTAAAQTYKSGAASLTAAAVLTAAGKATELPSAHLAAAPSLTAAPLVTHPAAAHLTAASSLTAFYSSASAALHAQPTIQVTASALRAAIAHLSAAATMLSPDTLLQDQSGGLILDQTGSPIAQEGAGVDATVTEVARAALAASAHLTANAHGTQPGAAHLTAAASLTARAGIVRAAVAHLTAAAVLTPRATRSAAATAHLSATAALTSVGSVTPGAHLSASAHLAAAGTIARTGRAALSAHAALTATAHGTTLPKAALTAGPVLRAVPLDVIVSQARLAASASLAASAETKFARPLPLPPRRPQPAWQRDVQHFAIAQERQRHAQALWQYGELVMFALLWTPAELDLGLAQRCTRCYVPATAIPVYPPQPDYGPAAEAQISAAYGQGNQYRCPLCYGTQLIAAAPAQMPGVRALLVRPAILTDTDQNQQRTAKGVVKTGSVSVQVTPDFRVNTLDYCFRSDGRRYQLRVPARTTLRTGFAGPWQQTSAIDYNLSSATLEDPKASVAYIIPPPAAEVAQVLGTYTRIPADYAWIEQINGPLIPGETPPPAASGSYQAPVTFPLPAPSSSFQAPPPEGMEDQLGDLLEDQSGAGIYDQAGSST